nr:single-stranded-DNA-specific exonuclease RecJ [Paenibacillus caui]
MHSHYRWSTLQADREASAKLADLLNISPMLASLLVTRGLGEAKQASAFLHAGAESLHDPYELHGMKEAVLRIRQALENKEHILIYGDYDADGVSSTALMIRLMTYLEASFEWYVPHRSKEGYGLHNHALDEAAQHGVTLVITVDTGISAVEQVEHAKRLGMDVIVTDHHEPPAVLPDAYTLINPKLPFCLYPFKGLAGVGVAYKLACALAEEVPEQWLQLVALGTVADLMPLTGENRIMVAAGLDSMVQEPITGAAALLRIAGSTAVNSTVIGFGMAPRINASGRLAHAREAVELLTTQDPDAAEQEAEKLDLLNRERQQIVENIENEAVAMLEARAPQGKVPPVIVLAGEGWNVGVVGIVASKIVEKYYRPVLILGIDAESGMCKGSARSIPGFDMYEALTHCAGILDHYGGHPSAAGMSLHRSNLDALSNKLIEFAERVLTEEHYIPMLAADLECTLDEIGLQAIEQLSVLEPFGMNNGSPRFLIRGTKVLECRQMGRDRKHLKVTLQQNGSTVEAVAFGKGPLASLISEGAMLDLIAEASVNEWNGTRKPQLMLLDAAVQHLQVFDYRGTRSPGHKLEELVNDWNGLAESLKGRAGLVCRPDSGIKPFMQLQELPIWVYDRSAGLIRESGGPAALCSPCEVTTLFVIDSPETPQQLDSLIASFAAVERIYLLHSVGEIKERVEFPSREQFKKVYALLRKAAVQAAAEADLLPWLSRQTRLSVRMLAMTLEVFEELNFISRNRGMVTVNPAPSKQQLESSIRYKELSLLAEMEHYLLYAEVSQLTEWIQTRMKGAS